MGYYTNYTLEVSGKGPIYDRLMREASEIVPNDTYGHSLKDLMNEEVSSIKWYSYRDDMSEVSLQWPNVIFTLKCIGEDHEMWVVHFMNGTYQKSEAKIVYDDPDPAVLRYIPGAEEKVIAERKAELQATLAKVQAELDKLG